MRVLSARIASWVCLVFGGFLAVISLAVVGLEVVIGGRLDRAAGDLLLFCLVLALGLGLLGLALRRWVKRWEFRGPEVEPSREQAYGAHSLCMAAAVLFMLGPSAVEAFREPPNFARVVASGLALGFFAASSSIMKLHTLVGPPPGTISRGERLRRIGLFALIYCPVYGLAMLAIRDHLGWTGWEVFNFGAFALAAPLLAWQIAEGVQLLRIGRIRAPADPGDGAMPAA